VIERCLGKKAVIELLPKQAGDVTETYADISKAARMIDYRPVTGIEEGVGRFVDWYRSEQSNEGRSPR
jgi:UDP-glucuronate 4-epimerase